MKVIDSRSGREMRIGDLVEYPDGESVRLIDVDEGLLSASAIVEVTSIDWSAAHIDARTMRVIGTPPLRRGRHQVPMTVRFLHPNYRFQKVAFLPS